MKYRIIVLLAFIPILGISQEVKQITLTECFSWAKETFPMMKQKEIAKQVTDLQTQLIELRKKPTISWNAIATVQSEAISLDLPIPGFEGVDLPLFRGQTTLDANYTIYDGGILDAQKKTYEADLKVKEQEIEVEFESVKPQITKAFLSIILLKQQIIVLEQAIKTIQAREAPLEVAIQNGVTLPSSLQRLKIEVFKLENTILEIKGSIQVLVQILEAWTGRDLADNVQIVLPNLKTADFAQVGKHPEYELFELKKQQILTKESLLTAQEQPKVGAFVQAGLGYPNPLNFFDATISPFAIVGVKFQWNFIDWGKTDKERQLLSVSTHAFDVQKEMFEKSLSIADKRYEAEILKIESLLDRDQALIGLYDVMINELNTQVNNGVTTTTEYINQVNEQTQAKLQLETHLVQLQQVKVEYLSHKGLL